MTTRAPRGELRAAVDASLAFRTALCAHGLSPDAVRRVLAPMRALITALARPGDPYDDQSR